MKSERRHELQHNALLDWLMKTGGKIQPYMNAILLGIVIVVVGVLGYRYMSTQSANEEAMAWDSVFQAMNQADTAQLDQTAEDYPSTTAAQWAVVVAADLQLSAGCQDLFTSKATADDQFQKAQEKYTKILGYSREPVIRERATYGLARTYESMAGTWSYEKMKGLPEWQRAIEKSGEAEIKADIEEARKKKVAEHCDLAIESYKDMVKNWPDGSYADAAQARLNVLSQTSTKDFYVALAAWQPRSAITSPGGLESLNIPFDQPGGGLDVGTPPKDFFEDITGGADESMEAPVEGEPDDGAGEAAVETGSTEIPAMPAATGDKPAEDGDKPAVEEGSE